MTVTREQINNALYALGHIKTAHDYSNYDGVYEAVETIRTVLQSALDVSEGGMIPQDLHPCAEYGSSEKYVQKTENIDMTDIRGWLEIAACACEEYARTTTTTQESRLKPSVLDLAAMQLRNHRQSLTDKTPDTAALDALLKLSEFCTLSTHETCTLRETIRAALTRPIVGWMPIESAPDGKRILCYFRLYGGYNTEPDVFYRNGDFWFTADGMRCTAKPIEWQPIPAAPKGGE